MRRTKAWRRHQRRRWINRRKRIYYKYWGVDPIYVLHPAWNNGSIFDKGKVHCSCEMCKPSKRRGTRREVLDRFYNQYKGKWEEYE